MAERSSRLAEKKTRSFINGQRTKNQIIKIVGINEQSATKTKIRAKIWNYWKRGESKDSKEKHIAGRREKEIDWRINESHYLEREIKNGTICSNSKDGIIRRNERINEEKDFRQHQKRKLKILWWQ